MQVSQNRRVMDRQAILPRTPNEVLSSALLRQNARAHFIARHEINLGIMLEETNEIPSTESAQFPKWFLTQLRRRTTHEHADQFVTLPLFLGDDIQLR